MPGVLFAHALFWTGVHVVGLGLVLRAQSRSKFLTRHFLTHYHYPQRDAAGGAVREAFGSWKAGYNACLCMTFVSAGALTYATYAVPDSWTSGDALLRHLLGAALVALHAWVSRETYDVLGPFGWFYGDFFLDGWARELDYSGIYRYLNNPEILSGAAFFGLALVSGSKLVFALAGVRTAAYWWFLRPHMKKLYGEQLRREAGFQKVVGQAALARAVTRSRLVRTLDRAFDEAGEAIEEFIDRARPKLEEVVQDTRTLFQSGRERLVIARTASPSTLPTTERYRIQADKKRYHIGEPIEVKWDAPMGHSRKDWVGIYRVGANASTLITRTSSLGCWVPVHGAEWDGDVPIEPKRERERTGSGKVVFSGGTLPWSVGVYEIRYHHDGKYNVLAHDGPLEIYAARPATRDFASVRGALARVVPLCLDQDPRLVPLSTLPDSARARARSPLSQASDNSGETDDGKEQGEVEGEGEGEAEADEGRDPDDFRFWDKAQAVRISKAAAAMFGLELAPAVIMADANLSALAQRIVAGLNVLNDGVEEE
ncbi:unnamed protein product [Peniophora sp. CBMAI 1063]|nr:unnamed protein product [Peniophora sp. CBMAI 1063]